MENEEIKKKINSHTVRDILELGPDHPFLHMYHFLFFTILRTFLSDKMPEERLLIELLREKISDLRVLIGHKEQIGCSMTTLKEGDLFLKYIKKDKIELPNILKAYYNMKNKACIVGYSFVNYNLRYRDIEDIISFGSKLAVNMEIDRANLIQGQEDMFNLYKVAAKSRKVGISRASGNGSVLTLPKAWVNKHTVAFLIEE